MTANPDIKHILKEVREAIDEQFGSPSSSYALKNPGLVGNLAIALQLAALAKAIKELSE